MQLVGQDSDAVVAFRSAAERYVAAIEGAEGRSVERVFAVDLVAASCRCSTRARFDFLAETI